MHEVDEDGATWTGVHVSVTLSRGSVQPRMGYFKFLDALCGRDSATTAVQFTHEAGLARAALTGAALAAAFTLHAVGLASMAGRLLAPAQSSSSAIADSEGLEADWQRSVLTAAWCAYMLALCTYHASEFAVTMRFNGSIASNESWLLDQSRQYQAALAASWVEFWLEYLLLPGLKASLPSRAAMLCGLALVCMGQAFRTGAMLEAKGNFTHMIQFEKAKTHKLVTSGPYRYVRHPSYFGWFWWSIGTQLVLANPLCLVAYGVAALKFFSARIPVEEETLVEFFPDEFPAFRDRTPLGIPFIRA